MSDLTPSTSVLPFFSVLFNELYIDKEAILKLIEENFDKGISFEHSFFPMKEYYSSEMGSEDSLKRFFYFIPQKRERDFLVSAKILCDTLEKQSLRDNARIFNIDPGYISLDQVLLATGKPYSHRVHLQDGVYAELTYRYQNKTYSTFEWTYPDYCHEEIIAFFNWAREFHFS